jgi:hypothetical protein
VGTQTRKIVVLKGTRKGIFMDFLTSQAVFFLGGRLLYIVLFLLQVESLSAAGTPGFPSFPGSKRWPLQGPRTTKCWEDELLKN